MHFTNQTTINAILNIKNEQAKKKKITLEIVVPKDFILVKVTDMDLVIILANCLDNAIEAVEKIGQLDLQKIKIVILSDETGILIMIENPVLEKLDLNRLETTKNEKGKHGFGIKNIKSIVEKYEGNFQIEVENQLFMYGDNVIEKCGKGRDDTGDIGKRRSFNGKSEHFRRERPAFHK